MPNTLYATEVERLIIMQSTSKIKVIIINWLNDVFQNNSIPNNVLALNFHIQRTHNEFEIYLTGHDDFYHDHDTWLLSEVFEPKTNYIGLGIDSTVLSDREMYDIYKHEVFKFIKDKIDSYPKNVHYFNCRHPVGLPELLFER